MPHMDAFDANAFHLATLTLALVEGDHAPGRIGELGIFESHGIRTDDVTIERQDQTLALIPISDRGAPKPQNVRSTRNSRKLTTVRIALEDAVSARSLANVRAFGTEDALADLQTEVNERNMVLSAKISVTEEWQRMGALKGIIYDADGSTVIYDLFTEFGVSVQSTVNWDLDNGSPVSGALRKTISGVQRTIRQALGKNASALGLRIRTFCSATFFDDLVAHPEFVANHQNYVDQALLREQSYGRVVTYGGMIFEEYEGTVGGQDFLAAGSCISFPENAPGNFITRYSPGEDFDLINTMGLPRYAATRPDPNQPNARRILDVASYPLHICARPRTLVPGTRT